MKEGELEKKEDKKIPAWQLFYDDIFLLFVFGLAIPVIFYLIWGLIELANVRPLQP
jgi:hypothetical protein